MVMQNISLTKEPNNIFQAILITNHYELIQYSKLRYQKMSIAADNIIRAHVNGTEPEETPDTKMLSILMETQSLVQSVNHLLSSMVLGMNKALIEDETVLLVNDKGGYSIHEVGEYKVHSAGKFEYKYPNINKKENSKHLVIENGDGISEKLQGILNDLGITSYSKITELKTLPFKFVQKVISEMINNGLEEIIFETQFVDYDQVAQFRIFLDTLPKLRIRILTLSESIPDSKHEVIVHNY